jgi:hypothetical protein
MSGPPPAAQSGQEQRPTGRTAQHEGHASMYKHMASVSEPYNNIYDNRGLLHKHNQIIQTRQDYSEFQMRRAPFPWRVGS